MTASASATDDLVGFACSLVLADGSRWGEVATGWQVADLRAVLSSRRPRWHFLTRPRGASKTTDLAVVALTLLVHEAPALSRSYAVAADADQAGLLLDAMRGLVARTPGVGDLVRFDVRRVTVVESGATLETLSADAPSAFGLLPWLAVVDEVAQHADTPNARRVWEAVVSAVPKVRGSRLVVLTSAGDPAHWSHRVLVQARRSRRWRVSEVAGPCPWLDAGDLDELAQTLPASAYQRLILNVWAQSEDQMLDAGDVAACVTHRGALDPRAGVRYVVTLDLGWRGDATAIVVAHRDGDRVVVDRCERIVGTRAREVDLDAVEQRVYDLAREYRARVICDPAQAVALMQRLRRRGLRVVEHVFSAASNTRLALRLLELVRGRRLGLPDDDTLIGELCGVRIVERGPGLFRLDHVAGQHDDQAVAVGMACVHLDVRGSGVEPVGVTAAGRTVPTSVHDAPSVSIAFGDGTSRRVGPDDWRLRHARMVLRRGREPR